MGTSKIEAYPAISRNNIDKIRIGLVQHHVLHMESAFNIMKISYIEVASVSAEGTGAQGNHQFEQNHRSTAIDRSNCQIAFLGLG